MDGDELVKRLFRRRSDVTEVERPTVAVRNEGAPEPELAEPLEVLAPDAYEALRTSFTAAVSHELRTPLARILVLLDSASLPGADVPGLLEQARAEVEQAGELIDEILFLSELETGAEVVALGSTPAFPVVDEVLAGLGDAAARAGVTLVANVDEQADLPLRPRMLRVLVQNLAENAVR